MEVELSCDITHHIKLFLLYWITKTVKITFLVFTRNGLEKSVEELEQRSLNRPPDLRPLTASE